MTTDAPIISLKDVNVFQQKNLVLSQVNLQISPREFVYLIGRTGSGKSSFLKLLYDLFHSLDRSFPEISIINYHIFACFEGFKQHHITKLFDKAFIFF